MGMSPLSAADPRLRAEQHPTSWQASLVRLQVPLSRWQDGQKTHWVEDCTATLVATVPPRLLSAWHCFDGRLDLAKPARVLVDKRWHPVRLERSGGSMAADWALLSMPDILADTALALPIASAAPDTGAPIVMAGFSGDSGLGASGEALTYDPDCTVQAPKDSWLTTDCVAFKGASGGPVLQRRESGWSVTGVISARDPSGPVMFLPTAAIAPLQP